MSDVKHTAGPWKFKTDPFTGDCGLHAEGTGIFAEAFADIRHQGECNKPEALANARLIAAAPDMLEALKHILDSEDANLSLLLVETAIAKAEGRS